MARKSIFARIRDFFRGGNKVEEAPLPTIGEDFGTVDYTKLRDIRMPNQIKRLYDDLFNHVWKQVGHEGFNYDNFMQLSGLNPNNKVVEDFNSYLNNCFNNNNDTEFRIKLNRLNNLLGSEYSIKTADELRNFIVNNKYPSDIVEPPVPVMNRTRESGVSDDVPDYLKKDNNRTPREGFNPDRPSFMKKDNSEENLTEANEDYVDDVPKFLKKDNDRTPREGFSPDRPSFMKKEQPKPSEPTPKKEKKSLDVTQILEQVRSEIKEKSGQLGSPNIDDYEDAIKAFEAKGVLTDEEDRVYKSLLQKRDKLREQNPPKKTNTETDNVDKATLIDELMWRIHILSQPGRKDEPEDNRVIASRMIDDIIKRLEELGVHAENPLKKPEENKADISGEVAEISKKQKPVIRKLRSDEEVLDIDPAKKALLDYSDLKKINEKIASLRAKIETYRNLGEIDIAEECEVLLTDLENFRDEVATIKKEKQRAYRNMNNQTNIKIKNKMKARLDSLAQRQKRLEDDKVALIEMEQILEREIQSSRKK